MSAANDNRADMARDSGGNLKALSREKAAQLRRLVAKHLDLDERGPR